MPRAVSGGGSVAFAVGEQTLGSVLRPASYCGVTGFKPTNGLLSMQGVLSLAHSFDTLGFFTHTPGDMLALWRAIGQPVGSDETLPIGVPDPVPEVEPAMATAFGEATSLLRSAGTKVVPVGIAPLLAQLADAVKIVLFYEGAHFTQNAISNMAINLGNWRRWSARGCKLAPRPMFTRRKSSPIVDRDSPRFI